MNLVQKAVEQGGKLAPIAIPNTFGGMNPSVFIDPDGDILVNVRVVNYILYHSENKQLYPSRWGPLAYLHPEKDQRLVTENYLVRLNSDLVMTDCTKVEMLELHQPIWEFVGLEDARLVYWDDQTGVFSISGASIFTASPNAVCISGSSSGLTQFRPYALDLQTANSSYIGFGAEL